MWLIAGIIYGALGFVIWFLTLISPGKNTPGFAAKSLFLLVPFWPFFTLYGIAEIIKDLRRL